MYKVLIADDSPTARQALSLILRRAGDMQVVGEAASGREAVRLTEELRPDVVLMDITMPEMDGLQATGEIMHLAPTPIVVVSGSLDGRETEIAFQAIRAGALTVLPKPSGPGTARFDAEATKLINTVRAMAGVSVIHHWRKRTPTPKSSKETMHAHTRPEIVGIVSSTGGPAALSEILSRLPAHFPLPVVVVQHIAPDFLPSLIKWLGSISSLAVRAAEPGTRPVPGTVYVAPGHAHLCVDSMRRFVLDTETPGRHVPSGDVLFESVAKCYGAKAIGVVLTGMGDDGARGLRMMYDTGAFTIAQDEESSAVYGMPCEAVARGAACKVLPVTEIADALMKLTRVEEKYL